MSKRQSQTARRQHLQQEVLERVQRLHFQHFLDLHDPTTGLVLDRSLPTCPASIAATGFALTSYPVAVEHGWISWRQAAAYTIKVLRTLWNTPQGPQADGTSGYRGFFYHFLSPETGLRATKPRFWMSELSSIDTALLMSGVLLVKNYFRGDSSEEIEIRSLSDQLYQRVEWDWLLNDAGLIQHGWTPESGLLPSFYQGLNEAALLYILALGSPTHPVPAWSWREFIGNSKTEMHYRQRFIRCIGSPLFVYQYPQIWIDFRGINDDVNRSVGFDYFQNSRRAAIAQHLYAINNPMGWKGYDQFNWGISASDGPGNLTRVVDGRERLFFGYNERGAPGGTDDGTIAPSATLACLPFAPGIVLKTLKHWLRARPELLSARGFYDAFNQTFDGTAPGGWVDSETVSIDQGPILLMIENYQTGLVWRLMKDEPYLRAGLTRAGFSGGWLSV